MKFQFPFFVLVFHFRHNFKIFNGGAIKLIQRATFVTQKISAISSKSSSRKYRAFSPRTHGISDCSHFRRKARATKRTFSTVRTNCFRKQGQHQSYVEHIARFRR